MNRVPTMLLVCAMLALPAARGEGSRLPAARLELSPSEATVGDRLSATLTVILPPEARLETRPIGTRLGRFHVVGGSWSGPFPEGEGRRWSWTGFLVVFRTGRIEVPALRVEFRHPDGSRGSIESDPVVVLVRSVLDEAGAGATEAAQIADLKPPASLAPDYSGLRIASGLVLLLLLIAAAIWWLQRRLAAKIARVETPDDPFRRLPPHLWVYGALKELLDRRLPEQGQVDRFFMELSRIVKVYLGGRYRVDLLERTSGEVPGVLEQARTPGATIDQTTGLLGLADRVKFAGERPEPERCHRAVETAYGIVDATKPREEAVDEERRGAA